MLKDDRKLVEACIAGDMKAWSCLIDKYSRLVYISVENRLKKYGCILHSHEIEDIRQEIFTAIWREDKLKSIVNTDDISYWIAIVSGNAAISHLRKDENRENPKTISIHEKFNEKELADILPSKTTNPDDYMTRKEIAERLDAAIRKLPPREKLIIKLHLIHDKKYHAIAKILNIPKGTVSSCIKRSKEKLKARLKDFLIIFATISHLFTSYIVGALINE